MTLNPGMRESGITVGYFDFPMSTIKPENEAEFKRQLVEDVRNLPGIQNAAATTNVPLGGSSWSNLVHVGANEGSSKFTYASPSYFATMSIPLLTGRKFAVTDTSNSPPVLIVNQTFIRHFIGSAQPIGQLVRVMPEPQYPGRTYEIIGTIPDTKYSDLRGDPPPMAFVPDTQLPVTAQGPWMSMMIASDSGPAAISAIRRSIQAKYPDMVMQFFDFQQGIRDNLVGDRMMAMLSGFFGLLAALLVVVGLYGVLSYFISQRRNEIGIRIALGAKRWQVIALVMRDTAAMLLLGVIFGTALALLAGRSASAMLFGLKAYDPVTLGFTVVLLAVIAALASWLPARNAANLDPVAALRSE
jgi:predicted permease